MSVLAILERMSRLKRGSSTSGLGAKFVEMPTPPEIVFDRFLRNTLPPAQRQIYKGKLDLDTVSHLPGMREMLVGFQEGFQQTLCDSPEQAEYVPHPPIHFDYIEATVPNALAFLTEDFSFVGVTLPLILELLHSCVLLSRSEDVGTLLAAIPGPDKPRRIIELLHSIQLSFVFAHEYTHIVHGHTLPATPESMFADEIKNGGEGNIELQAQEVDADGYASFLVLNDLLNGPRRALIVQRFGLEERPFHFRQPQSELEDLTLFGAFVLALGGYFYLRVPDVLDNVSVYNLTHPPQAVRMVFAMRVAMAVATQNREHIASKMTPEKAEMFMGVTAKALHGSGGTVSWDDQNAFYRSEQGQNYTARLTECVKNMPPSG